jgi:hypothetical protein
MHEIGIPKVGDRIALPNHSGIFMVKSVNQLTETADADLGLVERDMPSIS